MTSPVPVEGRQRVARRSRFVEAGKAGLATEIDFVVLCALIYLSLTGIQRAISQRAENMRMTFDPEADAAYVYLVGRIAAAEVTSTRVAGIHLDRASINVDFDDNGKALGIEIVGASRVLRRSTLDDAGEPPPIAGALLSVNRSIWGMVTPNLRGVCCQLTDTSLRARFMYADEPDEWTLEEVSCAETECVADFWQSHEVSYVAEHLPPERARDLMPGERWVYLRYEAPAPD